MHNFQQIQMWYRGKLVQFLIDEFMYMKENLSSFSRISCKKYLNVCSILLLLLLQRAYQTNKNAVKDI